MMITAFSIYIHFTNLKDGADILPQE